MCDCERVKMCECESEWCEAGQGSGSLGGGGGLVMPFSAEGVDDETRGGRDAGTRGRREGGARHCNSYVLARHSQHHKAMALASLTAPPHRRVGPAGSVVAQETQTHRPASPRRTLRRADWAGRRAVRRGEGRGRGGRGGDDYTVTTRSQCEG